MVLHGGGHLELKKMHRGDFSGLFCVRLGRSPGIFPEKNQLSPILLFYSSFLCFFPNALALYTLSVPHNFFPGSHLPLSIQTQLIIEMGIKQSPEWNACRCKTSHVPGSHMIAIKPEIAWHQCQYYLTCSRMSFPANTGHLPDAVSMLDQRRRRWANIETVLSECPVFAGNCWPNPHRLGQYRPLSCQPGYAT